MSGASFAITLDELQVIVANDRGYSLNPARWNDKQKYVINDVVVSGVAQVYFPAPSGDEKVAPDWTFLKPISEIALKEGSSTILLPDDFGNFDGPVAVKSNATTIQPWWIDWTNEGILLQMFQATPMVTGPPKYAADIPSRIVQAPGGQMRSLMVFPTPDQDYILQVRYSINPDKLSGARPYCYGGAQFRELYIASCLAVAERRFDLVQEGPAFQHFKQMLLMAISQDNKNRPQKLGYNGNSEVSAWRGHRHNNGMNFYYNDELIT